jgi:hypothetical protein
VDVNGSVKHSNLLQYGNNYGRKKLYSAGPGRKPFGYTTFGQRDEAMILPFGLKVFSQHLHEGIRLFDGMPVCFNAALVKCLSAKCF